MSWEGLHLYKLIPFLGSSGSDGLSQQWPQPPEETSPVACQMLTVALAGEDGGQASGPSRPPCAQVLGGENKANPTFGVHRKVLGPPGTGTRVVQCWWTAARALCLALLAGSADDWLCDLEQVM